ncbi:MAG: SCO family protein [Deltaproteobacteria bacterium]|nr:SCO family protein [Deltaproteobacteria bacterium]
MRIFSAIFSFAFISFAGLHLFAEENLGKPTSSTVAHDLSDIKITENLGAQVDIDGLHFKDEDGQDVALSKYFRKGKPVIITLVYYGCPNLCTFMLNGLSNGLRSFAWNLGEKFDIVTVSINPNEGSSLATQKKAAYLKEYGRRNSENGWHFLTGQQDQIEKLAGTLGFGYRYDPPTKEYIHGSAIFVLTPEGKISRILYGIDFPEKNLKLSLLEASNGKVGTVIDRFLMFCYQYNPNSRGYALYAMRIVQVGGALTILILGIFIFSLWRRERFR